MRNQRPSAPRDTLLASPVKSFRLMVAATAAIAASFGVYLYQWSRFQENHYELQRLEEARQRLDRDMETLAIERGYLTRPQRLAEWAARNPRLAPPPAERIVRLDDPPPPPAPAAAP